MSVMGQGNVYFIILPIICLRFMQWVPKGVIWFLLILVCRYMLFLSEAYTSSFINSKILVEGLPAKRPIDSIFICQKMKQFKTILNKFC